jgi:hypothetical protein
VGGDVIRDQLISYLTVNPVINLVVRFCPPINECPALKGFAEEKRPAFIPDVRDDNSDDREMIKLYM